MGELEKSVKPYFDSGLVENAAVYAELDGRKICGYYSPGVNGNTLFDMASVTKILSVTQLFLIALEKGAIGLYDPVSKYFGSRSELTVCNLLTHTMGIGHKNLCADGVNYGNVAEYILSIPCDVPVGKEILYSCPAFILLGKILEKVYGGRLDKLFLKYVAAPLGMERTSFLPAERDNIVNANDDPALLGTVNDYNCRFLGGIAGNAGIFSCVNDLKKFAKMLIRRGAPLYSEDTFRLASRRHEQNDTYIRGLGYLVVDERYAQTGSLFPAGSVGHCGHTGQSVFADPESGLFAVILTDATKHARGYAEVKQMRARLHNAIKADMDNMLS